jgi:hypothetical protein
MTRYLALIFNILVFAVVFIAATPAFDTNDDAVSFFQTSGCLTGTPDGRLIFSHPWVGGTLAWLYRILPGPNWYVWYLYGALLLSNVFITKLLLENAARTAATEATGRKGLPSKAILGLAAGWNLLFFCTALLRPQYTLASMWLGAAGWLWLYCKLPFRDDSENSSTKRDGIMAALRRDKSSYLHFFIATAFLLLSALVRWHAFLGISILLVPVLGYHIKGRRRWLWFGFAAMAGLLLYFNEYLNQQQQPVETSMAYQVAIDAVVNGPNNLNSENIKDKQFTINDLNLLKQWFWVDKTVFLPEKIIRLSDGIRQWRTPYQGLQHIMFYVSYNWLYVLVWLFVGPGLWIASAKVQRKRMLGAGLWLCLVLGALAISSRTPFHVFFPFVALLMAALSIVQQPDWAKLRWPLLVLMGIAQVFALNRSHENNSFSIAAYQRNTAQLRQNPATLYVVAGAAFPYEGSFSWWYHPEHDRLRNLLPSGYLIHTPLYNDVLRQWNMDNLATDLRRRNDVQLLGAPVEALEQFYLEKYPLEEDLRQKE